MLMSALYELIDDKEAFIETINSLGLAVIIPETSEKSGIAGTHIRVVIGGAEERSEDAGHEANRNAGTNGHYEGAHSQRHSHNTLEDITKLIESLNVSEPVKVNTKAIYALLAEAEASVHGKPVSAVHFHEVGARDAVADIAGVCILMEKLSPDHVVVSPIHVGSGFVRCSHGLLPIPAPATGYLLQGAPTYGGIVQGELCTPTGAALLKYFADSFSPMPVLRVHKIGYGMGAKDFAAANCVRAFWGESEESAANNQVIELKCNLDDMTGEAVGYAQQILFDAGARDVFTIPVQMKKDRPGFLLTCICDMDKADYLAKLMLKHTTTFGVRKTVCERYILDRNIETISTSYGKIRVKTGTGYGMTKSKTEYEDAAEAARRNGIALSEVQRAVFRV